MARRNSTISRLSGLLEQTININKLIKSELQLNAKLRVIIQSQNVHLNIHRITLYCIPHIRCSALNKIDLTLGLPLKKNIF